jgi:hypothetical protein
MPGIATHFHVLDRAIDELAAAGMTDIADLMRNNPYAYLGAVGPALMDFISSDPPPPGATPPDDYAKIWRLLFSAVGGDTGLVSTLAEIQNLIDELQTLADNEDCHGLEDFRDSGKMKKATDLSNQFAALISNVVSLAQQIFGIISQDLRPKFCTLDPNAPTPPPTEWPARDFLSWKKTGQFAKALIARANSSGDKRLLAYAYGYLVAFATSATGSPFVNSVVGGPPRTQWWRQRFIKNYVDAWVYGFYNAGAHMTGDSGDIPNPPYDQWPSLCAANLHTKIELPNSNVDPKKFMASLNQPFPQVVPGDFANNWALAVQDVFGGAVPPQLVAGGLNSAYLMTWLVLWFQTAGPLGCNLKPPPGPPDACTGEPSDLDPFNFGPGGSPPGPPDPSPDVSENTGVEVCGIILIILGGIGVLAGGAAAGAAAIGEGISLLDCSNAATIDWKGWKCKIFWFREYIFNGLVGLQRMLSLAGFTYPEAKALGFDTNALNLSGIKLPFESAINLVKSPREGRDQPFPSKCWNTTGADEGVFSFNQRPDGTNPGFETPRTIAYIAGWQYPSWFVEDPGNPLSNGEVKSNGGTLLRFDPPATATPFGNAVENAVDLFKNLTVKFPNWNLDGDRGIAYYTWQFKAGYDPDNVQVVPEP